MKELTGLDASFLYLETPNSPMHLGSVSILEGALAFSDFRELILSRIHLVPSFRQRLVTVPLSLDRPYWVDDPNFNIDWHLHHTALPKPGGWRQLRKLAARIFSQPLDRSRPLWEMAFIEGLNTIPQVPPGSVAVISKIHHAAIDGMSGANIMSLLFDLSSEPKQHEPPELPPPPPLPSDAEIVARSAYNFATRPLKLPTILMETAKASFRTGVLQRASRDAITLPFTAPPSPLNRPISSARIWNTALLSLDRIKQIKNVMGFTVNDVVLAICAGALRRYLLEKKELPDKPLVAMVPVSIRPSDEAGSGGNQVSAMFLQLATDIEDPIERLRQIHQNAEQGKGYQGAIDAKKLIEVSEFVPFGLAGSAARVYSRTKLSDRHRPVFNCVITNVPGPQLPLYLAGKRLLAQMGMAPIFDGMGLMMPVFSYNGVVSISPTSSPHVMPDLDRFTRYLWEAANELEAAVLALDVAPASKPAAQPVADVRNVFQFLQQHLATHPEMELRAEGVYQFEATGPQAQQWVFDLNSNPRQIYEGVADKPDCTLRMADKDVLAMTSGKLDGTAAFMQGKLKIEGNINAAIAFGKVLARFPRPPADAPIPVVETNAVTATEKQENAAADTEQETGRCIATTAAGTQCRRNARDGSSYCGTHLRMQSRATQ